jgi:hypothetical protein
MAYPALMRCLWSSTPVIAGRVGEAVLYRCSGRGCGAKSGRSGHVSRTQDVNAAANGSGRCDSSEWSASERRDAMMIRQKPPQEWKMCLAPSRDPFVIVAIGDRTAYYQQQHLR